MQVKALHVRSRLRLLPVSLAITLACAEAHGVGLGEPIVRSYIGSPLRIEVPLHLARGETVDEHCISLRPVSGGPEVSQNLPLELKVIDGERPHLLIESTRVAREPFATLRVRVECAGAALSRDFSVLLDPPPHGTASRVADDDTAFDGPSATATPLAGDGVPPASALERRSHARGAARSAHTTAAASAKGPVRDQLKLETAQLQARMLGGVASEGMPVLRLDMHMDTPPALTASLVTERAQLRDLRALMLSGDDTLERLLALQTQVGSLETQLKALQGGGAAAPGALAPAPAAVSTVPPIAAPDDGATATAAATPAAPQIKVTVRKPAPPPAPEENFDWTLPLAGAGAVLLTAGGLAFARHRRRGRAQARQDAAISADESALIEAARAEFTAKGSAATDRTPSVARPDKAESIDQSAEQAARAAYLAQRFPEIAAGLIQLHDADSVVNGARLYVESGDQDRAEELLEAAIHEAVGRDVRPWLGLFEVLRLRRHTDAFAGLLGKFRERFQDSRYLPEILAVGRSLDPDRAEFAPLPGSVPMAEIGPDGTTWLSPELDFVPLALAQDLHDTLMAELADDEGGGYGDGEFTLSPVEVRRT
ncbi:MAG: hypothetical protein KGI67_06155 [Pseudomonadota bacterium]|nr:hypothetical protein [Pseudomonadota bacterium]